MDFARFTITPTTVRPCSRYLEAIENSPIPQNITDICSWFGLINQVSYAFMSATHMLPFRNLLKPSAHFEWTPELKCLFNESKAMLGGRLLLREAGLHLLQSLATHLLKVKPLQLLMHSRKQDTSYWDAPTSLWQWTINHC